MLAWEEAHAGFDKAAARLAAELRGRQPAGLPYSPWQLLEHLRITQHDILEFCRNPNYVALNWPEEYWPTNPAPPSESAWDNSASAFVSDREALVALAADPARDLLAPFPHGDGQTLLRELLLAADHAAYHIGELIVVRRLLNAWPAG